MVKLHKGTRHAMQRRHAEIIANGGEHVGGSWTYEDRQGRLFTIAFEDESIHYSGKRDADGRPQWLPREQWVQLGTLKDGE